MLIVLRKYSCYIFHSTGDIYCMGDQLHVHADDFSGLKRCTHCDGWKVILFSFVLQSVFSSSILTVGICNE